MRFHQIPRVLLDTLTYSSIETEEKIPQNISRLVTSKHISNFHAKSYEFLTLLFTMSFLSISFQKLLQQYQALKIICSHQIIHYIYCISRQFNLDFNCHRWHDVTQQSYFSRRFYQVCNIGTGILLQRN